MCFLVHLTAHFCAFGKVAARKKKRSGAPIQRRRIRSCACFVRPSCSSVFRSVLLLLNCAVKSSYPPSAPLVYIVFRHTHHRRNYETALETAFPPPALSLIYAAEGGIIPGSGARLGVFGPRVELLVIISSRGHQTRTLLFL